MNRHERRKLLKEREQLLKKLGKSPLYPIFKAKNEALTSTCEDLQLLKLLCLASTVRPEPILISYLSYNENVFKKISPQLLMPNACYEQNEEGEIIRVVVNGEDQTEIFRQGMEATKKDFAVQGRTISKEVLLIETIKFLNLTFESLGGAWLDIGHLIFSKQSYQERRSEREKIINYWASEYGSLRHISFMDSGDLV
jgi:hypothetical protein